MKKLLLTVIAIIGIGAITIAQVPAYVPTLGLVGWWPFNSNASDASGNGNNGTPVGANLTTDRNNSGNSAYFFNGSSEIACGTGTSLNIDECTISAWVHLTTVSPLYQTILAKYDDNLYGSYALAMFGDKVDIWFTKDSTSYFDIESNGSLSINQWHHITATHSILLGTRLYINGVLDNSDNTAFNVLQAPNDVFRIGSQGPFFPVEIQNGKIDDIGVWKRVLTQTEITGLYNSTIVGLEKYLSEKLLSVYPNPSSGQFYLRVEGKATDISYHVYNSTGDCILKDKLNIEMTKIELGNLPSGIYFLRINSNEGETLRLIKE